MKRAKKVVICFGTFDLLHLGHLHYFRQARKHGDYLVVVIARDRTKRKQNKKTIFNELERLQMVQSLKLVDKAVLGHPRNHFKIIIKHKPEVICLGYDHAIKEKRLAKELGKYRLYPEIKRMKAYKAGKYKGGKMKKFILRGF
ncbi:MAG: adenylyltransferase/cytidyltransferase family protein [Nanoarchaeota archaeon]